MAYYNTLPRYGREFDSPLLHRKRLERKEIMNKNEEQIRKFIAHMNVFSQHQKAMEETTMPGKEVENEKNKSYEFIRHEHLAKNEISKKVFREQR